jgi:hypothetical protein
MTKDTDARIKELREEGHPRKLLTKQLISEGFKTKTGKAISDRWVVHRIWALNRGAKKMQRAAKTRVIPAMITLPTPQSEQKVMALIGSVETVKELLEGFMRG